MNTPRWFYAVIAGCAVVLTIAASLALLGSAEKGRYQRAGFNGNAILDTRTGKFCYQSHDGRGDNPFNDIVGDGTCFAADGSKSK